MISVNSLSVIFLPMVSSTIEWITSWGISFLPSPSISTISQLQFCLLKYSVINYIYQEKVHFYFLVQAELTKYSTGLQFSLQIEMALVPMFRLMFAFTFKVENDYLSFRKSSQQSKRVNYDSNYCSYWLERQGGVVSIEGREQMLAYFFRILCRLWNLLFLFLYHMLSQCLFKFIELVKHQKLIIVYYIRYKLIQNRKFVLVKFIRQLYIQQIRILGLKMSSKFKHVFNSFLKDNSRISVKLSILLHMILQNKKSMDQINKITKKMTQPLKLFRMLILLHECYLNNILDADSAIQLLVEIRSKNKQKLSKLDEIVCNQLINPYVLYLQKCYLTLSLQEDNQAANAQQILYRYLNLLKLGLSYVDILYTFGRYFKDNYQFIVDFNIILGKDFAILYENKIKSILKKNKTLWDQEMKMEIQKIHQKMYVVYYNCYYYKQLKIYVPKWIDTEPLNTHQRSYSLPGKKIQRNMRNSTKQNLSRLSTNCKSKMSMNSNQMSLSSVLYQTRPSPEEYSAKKLQVQMMANSTLVYYRQKKPGNGKKIDMSQSYCVSQFNIYNEKDNQNNDGGQLVIDQVESQNQMQKQRKPTVGVQKQKGDHDFINQNREDAFSLLESMERVVEAIDKNIFNSNQNRLIS